MSQSAILRVSSGAINAVNDAVIGQPSASQGPATTRFAGQLGKILELDDDDLVYDATIGTVYGGLFQYVRLAVGATAVVAGQIVFWDPDVAAAAYQVTTSEAGSTTGACFRAGIVLNPSWEDGNYSLIQIAGPTDVKFIATITGTPAIGSPVYCAAKGAGSDNGLADVLAGSSDPTDFTDVGLLQARYLGTALELPTNGGVTLVNVNLVNARN